MFFRAADKGNNEWYFYILGVFIIIMAYILGQIPMTAIAYVYGHDNPDFTSDKLAEFEKTMDFSIFGLNPNLGFLLALLIFVTAFFALMMVMKHIHKRNFLTLINFKERINLKKVFWGFGVWMLLGLSFELIIYFVEPANYSFTFNWMNFIFLLLISILILPIQTSFEELFLRGYLMQGVGLLAKNKWMPILATAVLFALMHGANPEVSKYGTGVMMAYYLFAGLFFGLITVMDDSLELALGIHFATNFAGTVILGYDGSAIQTESLFKTTNLDTQVMLFFLVISAIMFYILASRKYKWSSIMTIFDDISFKERQEDMIANNLN